MRLLHIDSSILGETSVSRTVSAAIVAALRKVKPGIDVTYRDLVAEPLAHLTLSFLPNHYPLAGGAINSDPSEQHQAASEAVLGEFLEADIVVIGAPMYNFTVPTQLKAWIDRIVITGKSFRYTPEGAVVGLAGDKHVIAAISRGGFYGTGTPSAPDEHLETYLRSIFRFIGVTKLDFVIAEGIQMGPEFRTKGVDSALRAVGELRLRFEREAAA